MKARNLACRMASGFVSGFHFNIRVLFNYNLFPGIGVQADCIREDIGNWSGLLYPSTY